MTHPYKSDERSFFARYKKLETMKMTTALLSALILIHVHSVITCSIEKRSIDNDTPWRELCEVDTELSKSRDKLENLRTDCMCSKIPDVEDLLFSLNEND